MSQRTNSIRNSKSEHSIKLPYDTNRTSFESIIVDINDVCIFYYMSYCRYFNTALNVLLSNTNMKEEINIFQEQYDTYINSSEYKEKQDRRREYFENKNKERELAKEQLLKKVA